MAATGDQGRGAGGTLNAAIARGVVRSHAKYRGKGPGRAHSFFRGNVVVVVLEDAATASEASLVTAGGSDSVLATRQQLGHIMRAMMTAAVENATGCHVEAAMSAHHLAPDVTIELFVLDQPLPCDDEPQ